MARKKKSNLPPKPECGSIEINKMIRALNDGKDNPCAGSKECDAFWKSLCKQKERDIAFAKANGHPPVIVYSLMEPDEYEEALLMGMLPD